MITMDKNDPNAALFGLDEESEEENSAAQTYDKNPGRVDALCDLTFDDIMAAVDVQNMPEEAKRKMIFKMACNNILDMFMDALEEEDAVEASFGFDMILGVAITNKRFNVDLFKEHTKALASVKPSNFASEEIYEKALEEFESKWWEIPQPKLNKRNPNDAIRESLTKYGLTD